MLKTVHTFLAPWLLLYVISKGLQRLSVLRIYTKEEYVQGVIHTRLDGKLYIAVLLETLCLSGYGSSKTPGSFLKHAEAKRKAYASLDKGLLFPSYGKYLYNPNGDLSHIASQRKAIKRYNSNHGTGRGGSTLAFVGGGYCNEHEFGKLASTKDPKWHSLVAYSQGSARFPHVEPSEDKGNRLPIIGKDGHTGEGPIDVTNTGDKEAHISRYDGGTNSLAFDDTNDDTDIFSDNGDAENKELVQSLRIRQKGENLTNQLKEYESLYSTVQSWEDSSKKKDRDVHKFIRRKIKEIKEGSMEEEQHENGEGLTVDEFLEALHDPSMPSEDKSSDLYHMHRYMKHLRHFNKQSARTIYPLKPTTSDVVSRVMKRVENEESCGYRYPIEGTPDERYSDPSSYKSWGRTELHQSKYLKKPSKTFGKVEPRTETLEEMILSTSPVKDDIKVKGTLEDIRATAIERSIDSLSSRDTSNTATGGRRSAAVSEAFHTTVDFDFNVLGLDFTSSNRHRQLELLLALNPYNPWDEYQRLKKTRSSNKGMKPVTVAYSLNQCKIELEIDGNTTPDVAPDDNGTDRSQRSYGHSSKMNDSVAADRKPDSEQAQQIPQSFIREYLHYFLMLPEDQTMMEDFENAEYLYDILRYFDVFNEELPQVEHEFRDLQDRLFSVVFPGCEGFPKKPKDPFFPKTMTPEKRVDNYRVNVINAVVALLRVQKLCGNYTADIYKEQRVKRILETIEQALALEVQRLKLGVVHFSIQELDAKLCEIDDAYLATLSAALSLFNIVNGIEYITEAMIVIVLSKIKEMRPKYLVATLVNLANIHSLPRSVFQKLVNVVMKHIEEQMKADLIKLAVDPLHQLWMDFETAARLLNVLSRYTGALNCKFMESYMKLYKRYFMELKVPDAEALANEWESIIEQKSASETDVWVSVRQPATEEHAELQKQEDEDRYTMRRDLNIHAARGRVMQYIWSLISCLSYCNMSMKYRDVIENLNMKALLKDFSMNSVGALSVIEMCTESTEEERLLVNKALASLVDVRTMLSDQKWVEIMEAYQEATLPRKDGKTPRLKVDRFFVKCMFNQFALLRQPKPHVLRKAIDILYSYAPHLAKRQLQELFRQMLMTVCDYTYMDRQSLNAERLDYPIAEMAYLLQMAAKCGVRLEEPWKNFLDLLNIFKHTLTLEDIREVLLALKASNYRRLHDICDLLLTRACDVIEVVLNPDEHILCDIMELTISLGAAPTKLLRWFLYLRFHEIPDEDMDRLSLDLVRGREAFDVDFRGWKRPINDSLKSEVIGPLGNLHAPIRVHKSKPVMPSEKLKYVMQSHTPEPAPYSGRIRRKEDVTIRKEIAERLASISQRTIEAGHSLSPADMTLLQIAQLVPQ